MALLQGAGPGLPNMDFLLEDFGHRLVPRKCISVGRSFSLWAPGSVNVSIIIPQYYNCIITVMGIAE